MREARARSISLCYLVVGSRTDEKEDVVDNDDEDDDEEDEDEDEDEEDEDEDEDDVLDATTRRPSKNSSSDQSRVDALDESERSNSIGVAQAIQTNSERHKAMVTKNIIF
jgi:hypothetical protein